MTTASNTGFVPLQLQTPDVSVSGVQKAAVSDQQPLTLLLHSAGGGSRSLAALAGMLDTTGGILVPDLNGYGRTVVNVETAGNSAALDTHRLVIDTLLGETLKPQQKLIIVGHSMGGFLGLLTALAEKWPVSAVVAVEPVAFSVLDPVADAAARAEDLEKVLALDAALKAGDPEQALGEFIGYWGNTEWAVLSNSMRAALLQLAPQIGRETLAVAHDATPPGAYKKLKLPVLLLQGTDTVSPASAVINRLQVLLDRVEVKCIPGTAHMGPVRQPELFAAVINTFLRYQSEVV